MENLEVRAKSFFIKWINAPDNSTIKWEVKPMKRSINFGIYRYKNDKTISNNSSNDQSTNTLNSLSNTNKSHSSSSSSIPTNSTPVSNKKLNNSNHKLSLDEVNELPKKIFDSLQKNPSDNTTNNNNNSNNNDNDSANRNHEISKKESFNGSLPRLNSNNSPINNQHNFHQHSHSDLEDRMDKHLVKEQWIGRCQGDELITGAFTVNTGGLYAFVFDNTFSRTKGKKIMFNQYIESFEDDSDSIITSSNNNNQDITANTQQRKGNTSDIPAPSPVISTSSNSGANIDNITTSSLSPYMNSAKDIQNPTPLSYSSLHGSAPVSSAATPEPFSPYANQSLSNSNTSLKNNTARSLSTATETATGTTTATTGTTTGTAATTATTATTTSNIPPPTSSNIPPPTSLNIPPPTAKHAPSSSSSIPQSANHRRSMDFSNNVKFQLPDNIRNDSTLSTSSSKMSRHNKKKNISSASTVLRAKGGQYLQGFLLKKKRRKSGGKNYVKRFFVLNFKYGVLDYYFDDNSNHIRGNMYIKNVIISANPNEMMIFLDSGIEQWILKAFSKKDFDYWVQAFNFIKKQSFNNIQQDSLQHRSTIDGLLDDTNQQIDSLQTIYDPVTHTTTNIDDDLDDDLSVDSRSGRSISKVSTTSRIRFKEIEDKIIALKELSNKVYYHSHEDPSSNMINNNSSTNNNSTNNSSTGLNVPPLQRNTSRRSSFFWKKRKDSNISDLNNNIGNNSNNNNNNNNNINGNNTTGGSDYLYNDSSVSLSSNSESLRALSEEMCDKIKDLEINFRLLMNTETNRGFSMPPRSPGRALSRSTTTATSVFSQEFYDAQEYLDEMNRGVLMIKSNDSDSDVNVNVPTVRVRNENINSGSNEEEEEDEEDFEQNNENSVSYFQDANEEITPPLFNKESMTTSMMNGYSESESSSDDDEYNEANQYHDVIAEKDETSIITLDKIQRPESKELETKEIKQDEKVAEEKESLDLYPLPLPNKISHRRDIKACTCDPPSLISFLRKNIGKDLTSIAMPVTSNEPVTFLQKYSESFEYFDLLNKALESDIKSGERILRIAAFAVTALSSYRAKVRNNRKPFNPLLGETYELVRDDLGFRLITEKVVHRPAVFAIHLESENWVIDHCPTPYQKFGGKSVEVGVNGTITLTNRKNPKEYYTWVQPASILKNLIAGEKYSEPYSTIQVLASNGMKSIVSFKISGMFSGRSETLKINAFSPQGDELKLFAEGSWIEEIHLSNGKTIWKAGSLVKDFPNKYGFTEFAASLNEITAIESDKLAPTDSRLRPDQRAYEDGDIDSAENLKIKLEEDQRKRRKDSHGNPTVHKPAFFKMEHGDELKWKYISGEKSYWNRRKNGEWNGLVKLW